MAGGRRARRSGEGQSLVVVSLFMTLLLAATAVGVDAGRMVSERRFLQNVADAAALAGAIALIEGKTTAEAEAAARTVLATNAQREPVGAPLPSAPTVPVYDAGHIGDPEHLAEGILVTSGEVRVALRNPVPFTFGKVVGLETQDITARARAGYTGGLLPIAVREYIKAPGPESGAAAPCSHDENRFMAVFATANSACLGSETNAAPRTDASEGADFSASNPNNDPSNHGPIVAILGQGSSPSNAADFRGFIALDIRNFATPTSQVYYNGVNPTTNENALKGLETGWILSRGYPGPGFPPVQTPPHPDNQVAILSGNSAGLGIDALEDRYALGEAILVGVYPGYVMAIPDFLIATPGTIQLPETGTVSSAGSFRIARNQAFTGVVTLSTLPDLLDPDNPLNLGTLVRDPPIDYDPNPVSPSLGSGTNVQMRNIETLAATPGVYALWIKGQAGSPYLTAKTVPLSLQVGDVTRDFELTADATGKVAENAGDAVTFTLIVQNAPNRNTNFGNPVALSVDDPMPAGTGSVSFSSSNPTPSRNGTEVTLTINTGSLSAGQHRFVVRATGMNTDTTPRKVTHLLPLIVNVAPNSSPGDDDYIDLSGFALMRIASMDSNTVTAYAITPVIADLSDERLRRGQTARLLPW